MILFIVLYIISFTILGQLGKKEGEQCSSTDSDDVAVYNISFWLCSFSFSVSTGAALLLPISIISNEVLLLYPNSYYVKWLNSSLIQGILNFQWCLFRIKIYGFLYPFSFSVKFLSHFIIYFRPLESCFSFFKFIIIYFTSIRIFVYGVRRISRLQKGFVG